MGAKESKQFPLTYEEAVKRGNWKNLKFKKNDLWGDNKKKLKWKWV